MQDRKVKLVYFSLNESTSKQLELTRGQFFSVISVSFVILLFIVSVSVALFTDFYKSLKISSLSKLNKNLSMQVADLGSQLVHIENRVKELEAEDDQLRIIASLPKIDSDTRNVGVGGYLNVNYETPVGSDELSNQVFQYQQIMEKLERRIELTRHSRQEVQRQLEENRAFLKHTPSIRPLVDGRITDRFGMRLHPIIDQMKRHPGIDISAERGTEVFATASGVVESVNTTKNINRGYGKYVIVDHGYGVKTLYGHLAKVLVREGQKIDRRDPIGCVGATGLATGPHLHYEVIQEGEQKDPMHFILN